MPMEVSCRYPCGGVLCRLKSSNPTQKGPFVRWNRREKIVGEDRRAPEQEVPNGGIAGWFGALFSRPVSVRVALDGLTKFELGCGWSLGKGGRGAVRALHA